MGISLIFKVFVQRRFMEVLALGLKKAWDLVKLICCPESLQICLSIGLKYYLIDFIYF